MEASEMKKLLNRSKSEPVNCALGISEDGKSAVLTLDKIKQPRALLQQMQKEHPKSASLRFGTVAIDEERDAKLVRFSINKPGSGLARRLVKALRGTGFSKVEIVLEDGSLAEAAGAEDDEQPNEPGTVAQPAATPAAAPPAHDEASLTRALSALAKHLADVADPAQRGALITLAKTAQAALKSGDLASAEGSIRELNKTLSAAAPAAKPTPRAIWLAAKEAVDGRLEALARELRSYDDPDLNQVAEFGLFGLSGGRETVGLTTSLMELESASPEQRQPAKAALAKAMQAYRAKVLDGNELVQLVDDNPFDIEVALQKTLADALGQIEQAIA